MTSPFSLLLLDPRTIQSSSGVELRLGPVTKSPLNPLFGEDRPWESSCDNLYPNVVFDPADRFWKLWYTPFLDRAVHEAQTLCYAQSEDGLRWTKPNLGLFEFRGSKANNILLPMITGAGVALDAQESDPSKRFKLTYLVHPRLAPEWAKELMAQGYPLPGRGAGVGFSADGVHWKLHPDNPVLPGIAGDTHNHWLWCEESRRYILITRANVPFADGRSRACRSWKDGRSTVIESGSERVVKRWESDDFLHWGNGQIVFRAEGDEIGRRQYYSMPTFRHGDGWLGLLALFNATTDDDSVDCELAWSPDSIHWQRLCQGASFIPRGVAGSLDGGCIYAGWSPAVVGDEQRIYYAGSPGTHSAGLQRHTSFLLATLPLDRFAGLAADGKGEIVTREMVCGGPRLFLNADASRGRVAVEVRYPDGSPVPGFEFTQCRPLRSDSVRGEVTWEGGCSLAVLVGRKVCLGLRLETASLYALEFGVHEAPP
ncbi:MAG: hypothetical protein ACOYMV_09910 [Verrucomicrobiia bacterium]